MDKKVKYHRYSGWPGAHCLDCGHEDPLEVAIADGLYDPWDKTYASDEDKERIERESRCHVKS